MNSNPENWQQSWLQWSAQLEPGDVGPAHAEADIEAAERRLGVRFPPSYRSFLLQVGGLKNPHFEASRLLSPSELRWLRDADVELVAEWTEPPEQFLTFLDLPRGEAEEEGGWVMTHLRDALLISPAGESTLLLLNPSVIRDGEWQACTFNDWHPGGEIHESFAAMLKSEAAMARKPND
jgi:hypothetical protein